MPVLVTLTVFAVSSQTSAQTATKSKAGSEREAAARAVTDSDILDAWRDSANRPSQELGREYIKLVAPLSLYGARLFQASLLSLPGRYAFEMLFT